MKATNRPEEGRPATTSAHSTTTEHIARVLSRFEGIRRNSGGWMARCPTHDDRKASLSIGVGRNGSAVLQCMAGCATEAILDRVNLAFADLFPAGQRPAPGTKRIVATYDYRGADGRLLYQVVRYAPKDFRQRRPDGNGGWTWRLGGIGRVLYRLDKLEAAPPDQMIFITEGEKDADRLIELGLVATTNAGGAGKWRPEYNDTLAGRRVVVLPDNDEPGRKHAAAVTEALVDVAEVRTLELPDLPDKGDVSDWLDAGHDADELRSLAEARYRGSDTPATLQPLQPRPPLATTEGILDQVADTVERAGLTGERRAVKLLYLAVTSRLLDTIVSVAVKGPSAGGKSYLVDRVLRLFPEDAYHALTGMSEHAMVYDKAPLAHRMLVIYEASGMASDFTSYIVRSLLSEGHLSYTTVTKVKGGALEPVTINREGPTGLITTTTAVRLHPENETRLLSLTVTDSPEQTRAVFRARARRQTDDQGLIEEWHRLQRWLQDQDSRVVIPYAEALADAIPPVAVRLRRDFGQVLTLIEAHAVLHQASRPRDADGRIVATLADYKVVRELVADLIADAVQHTVPATVRETVAAVASLCLGGGETTVTATAKKLSLDKSTAWRRVKVAIDGGYLVNLEDRRGRPARLQLGDPLPEDVAILPDPAGVAGLQAFATPYTTSSTEEADAFTRYPDLPVQTALPGQGRETEPLPFDDPPSEADTLDCADWHAHHSRHRYVAGRWVCEACLEEAAA